MRKLSEIKGNEVLDVLAEIVQPVGNIINDEKVTKLFQEYSANTEDTAGARFMKAITNILPCVLKDHRKDLIKILSTIDGVTAKQYSESLTMTKLFGDVSTIIQDEDLLAFLSPAASQE